MIQKVRLRLTLLSGGITTLILIIMTLAYLYISEKNILDNKNYSYQSDIYSIAAMLEQQNVISHTWLSQLEANDAYYISLSDNGVEFLFNSRLQNTVREQIVDNAWAYYRKQSENTDENNAASQDKRTISYQSSYTSFMMPRTSDTPAIAQDYYCFVISVAKNQSALEMLLIAPLAGVRQQIWHQRLLFLGIILAALAALWIFAWIFTGKLLQPIEENRLRQNQFVAAAAHELRTPLAVILSCSENACEKLNVQKELNPKESLEKDVSIVPAISHDLSMIQSEALRTSRLLGDMLTLSSLDANHFDMDCRETELDTLLLNVYERFESMARQKHIALNLKLPAEQPPACVCDSGRITQVVTILLHNAISYTPANGHILIALDFFKNYYEIKISDTGVGICDEEKDKIFNRFYRSEKARSDKSHFGLGLSIAQGIVTAHHGKITVSDHLGGGSTFSVLLPIIK